MPKGEGFDVTQQSAIGKMMLQDALRMKLLEIRPLLLRQGVEHLSVFGSRARGDYRHDSDLDLLLEISPQHQFSLLDLVEIERVVADKTGLPANAFMKRSLDAAFKTSIEAHVTEVF